ncbi:MAG TPA: FKBP-type peptidyl-prolyl cis-trans isomerase [Candidatus Saccharimonadales bacterium]|nr:FKBP-type peptidyl-prolyl cis-trans isomerase [Candidatus Saccharimonadales bacterium]
MASKKERFFAGFFALLFLVTSSTVAIIYFVTQSSSNNNDASQSEQQQSQEQPVDKLKGTKLANFTPVASVTQLQEIDLTPGTGATVKPGDTVSVDYTGAVASTGVVFQSTQGSGQQATFSLSQVIAGWSQGIPGMKVGGTRRLLIPSALAYAASPPSGSGIPANADLVFDVTVHKIDSASK